MPVWGWIPIGLAILAVIVLVVVLAVRRSLAARRTQQLRGRFGPEYDRTLRRTDGREEAEAQLTEREQRRQRFDIRPLSAESRTHYRERWHDVQAQFVDAPAASVGAADALIQTAMVERGYPVEDFDSRADDLSVDHPRIVEHYRAGHRLAEGAGDEGTEELRRAMRHYRALFDELVDAPADEPVTRDRVSDERDARQDEEAAARPRR